MTALARIGGVLAAMLLGALPGAAGGAEAPADLAHEALAICRGVRGLPPAERRARLEAGLALAERAAAADPADAVAHFAAFCNRGKRLQLAGLGLGTLGEVRRLRRDIDRALALVPDWPDALAGKGAVLIALPRLLGGDAALGEHLLRRALLLDPTHVEARTLLQDLRGDAEATALALAHLD